MIKKRIRKPFILVEKFITLFVSFSLLTICMFFSSCNPNSHEHTFSTEWTTVDDNYHWHAATCEHVEEVSDKAVHDWIQNGEIIPATEEAPGSKSEKCSVCGKERIVDVPQLEAHIHEFALDWSYDETYHWHSATCEHIQEIDSKDTHDWDDGEITLPATSETSGIEKYCCLICKIEKEEVIPKVGSSESFGMKSSFHIKDNILYLDNHYHESIKQNGYKFEVYEDLDEIIPESGIIVVTENCKEFTFSAYDNLKEVKFAEGCIKTPSGNIWQCDNLVEITFPSSLVSIENFIVSSTGIDTVNIYGPLERIENSSLPFKLANIYADISVSLRPMNSTYLESVYFSDDVTTICDEACYWQQNLKEVRLSKNLKTIGNRAFASCYELTNVELPNSVKTIENEAFAGCTRLTSIILPGSIETIGDNAFSDCDALETLNLENGIQVLEAYCFFGTGVKKVVIPDSVISIGEHAFSYSELEEITLSKSITEIADYTFCDTKISSIQIPDSVVSIGVGAFSGCKELRSVHLGSSVRRIEKVAFSQVGEYTGNGYTEFSINIPSSLEFVGSMAFISSSALITFERTGTWKSSYWNSNYPDQEIYTYSAGITYITIASFQYPRCVFGSYGEYTKIR